MIFRHIILIRFFVFKFFVVRTYIAYLMNLLKSINIESLIFLIYEFFAKNISIIKFIVMIWKSREFNEIEKSTLYNLWRWIRTRWQSRQILQYVTISLFINFHQYFLLIAFSILKRLKWFALKLSWFIRGIFFE